MKLAAPRDAFLARLQLAASICPTRTPKPILQDVLVSVLDDGLVEIVATDREVSVRTRLGEPTVAGEGRAALPAATLLSALKELPGDVVEIAQAGSQHVLTAGSAVFKLYGDDPVEFPSIPTVDMDKAAVVPLQGFVELCNRTMFAAAKDMGRYAFNGVYLELAPERVTLVATDGRRLAMATMSCGTGVDEQRSRILPIKGLVQLMRAAEPEEETLRIDLRENQVTFGLASTEIVAQLVEGEFPDFRAVLPAGHPTHVVLGREELGAAIRRAAVTAGEDSRSVTLGFHEGTLTVSSRQEGLGESTSDIDIDYDGAEVQVRFNPDFLAEYLRTVEEETLTFRFKDGASAGLFETPHEDGNESVYVVMPITS